MLTLLFSQVASDAGTGAVAFTVAATSGSGTLRIAASGAESVSVDASTANGTEREIGSGSESITVSALSASGHEHFQGNGSTAFAVPSLDASGSEVFTGSAAETLGAILGNGSGIERYAGSGAESIAVAQIAASSGNVGVADCAFGVPSMDGSGTNRGIARAESHDSGGGSGSDFVHWVPLPNAPPGITPVVAKPAAIAGRGRITVLPVGLHATGQVRFVAAAAQASSAPSIVVAGQHVRPVITGSVAMSATATACSGSGFHDLRPIEEEEIALMFAAAA